MRFRFTRLTSIVQACRRLFLTALDVNLMGASSATSSSALRVTRNGLATCIGPDGTTQWGPHNLWQESENVRAWGTAGVSSFGPEITGPEGSSASVAKFVEDTSNGVHRVSMTLATQIGRLAWVRFKVKAGERRFARVFVSSAAVADCVFDALTGDFFANGVTPFASQSASMGSDGWCTVTLSWVATLTSSPVYFCLCTTSNSATYTYAGDGASGLYITMGQCNLDVLQPYLDSTVRNRLGYSNDFTNVAWVKSGITPYEKTCTGPNGQPATTLVATSSNGTMFQSLALTSVCASGFVIRRRSGVGVISIRNSANTAWIPLPVSDDWQVLQNNGGTSGANAFCYILIATAGDAVDICDAQLNPGPTLWPYYYNPAAAPTPGPIYGQRTDYDPVTLACKGALIEAQSTNLLLNSAVPATQNITTTAQAYTVSMWGTGTCTLSGTATGVLTGTGANVRTSRTVTATAGTLTATFSGSNTNGQFEAGSLTSYIPTGAGAVVRVADTSSVGYDDLAKALPWLMDSNMLPPNKVENFDAWGKGGSGTGIAPVVTPNDTTYAAPDGTMTASKVVFNAGGGTTASDYSLLSSGTISGATAGAPYSGRFRVMGAAGTQIMFRHAAGSAYAFVTCSGLGIWDDIPGRTEIALSSFIDMTIAIRQGYGQTINPTATVWIWGAKLNPGPVAQTYYPQSSKQATIVFEGDLAFGAASGGMSLFALENGASNRVEAYKGATSSNLSGLVNANSGAAGVIASGVPFKVAIGFSPASAGVSMNGSAEAPITASAFAATPNILKIGNDAVGSAASSMHIRRLRIFNTNLPASTKQSLTR